ncbi:Sucrose-6-phosphate hydrolase (EC 3.2.1.B3) [Pediococcus damnosus]|uniref:Sucrose-6-phosphate hydrolase n=1 Tax=Pediococcus damnosus TaxID=51663 RepID=A0A0R2HQP5_9LACO|nr:sucrose-6-phosphate hydrolase [Pediococcus damnosus]AMV61446.1 Sucrose-6-phosphate hydrolase (EC 3.2.1.B3) [Pediococcus damnosus]AMV62189.1 Sucrose-6-phosphate hydrolase (EC 3.2.1.B3) [Pediococcus damnosus]AMV65809.1 Sucrose-6-phosphate hydrolase (EC 3.2.1.B3) [Pediococcus damnosus]AMV67950.1 Sucrose-6-phosphate hydrolase (EC 3.2.1.B3) [Pediococcus damnosus]AMV70146.1 Sucrose-6-phosphate hydrolase (EC 3.2.1.B3) [Pediococcus damnosus]
MINTWTTDLRYKPYRNWKKSYVHSLAKSVHYSFWRTDYHIQPATGLLNDPNGFSYFNGKWQLFYQSYPFGPVHGLKSWFHIESKDLVHWKNIGPALLPDSKFDSQGVYSGSALPVKNSLFIMYTGNTRDTNWRRHSYQNGAWLDPNNKITKLPNPLISNVPSNYTNEFRDPQITKTKTGYMAIIGGQNINLQGKILLFTSADLKIWKFQDELHFSNKILGCMIECPNLIFIGKKPVLIFCPQKLEKNILNYKNIYPNTYITGNRFDKKEATIDQPTSLKNLDDGFDIYATQAFNAPDGRALAISWVGLPDISYPTDKDGWANCLSLVKELTLKHDHLYQYPVKETQSLRKMPTFKNITIFNTNTILFKNTSNSYELEVDVPQNTNGDLNIMADSSNKYSVKISFNTIKGTVIVDRAKSGICFAEKYGFKRTSILPAHKPLTLNVFVDKSIIEIYLNKGYKVVTLRVFPNKFQNQINVSTKRALSIKSCLWNLTQVNKE